MPIQTQTTWSSLVPAKFRRELDEEDLAAGCDSPNCDDPKCDGSCRVFDHTGQVIFDRKAPLEPGTCPFCYEKPCGCHLIDIDRPCKLCGSYPCRCEVADEFSDDYGWGPEDYDPYVTMSQESAARLAAMSPDERQDELNIMTAEAFADRWVRGEL